ncbi:hypothetical protein [Streptomyces californicus]|uniref:hypothetical protein n=1 Tax=Streptomyces californicus TaxID=67351 RepID=UPI0033E7C3EE
MLRMTPHGLALAYLRRALAHHLPHVQSIRCRTLLTTVRAKAGHQLRAAHRDDALAALNAALSTA